MSVSIERSTDRSPRRGLRRVPWSALALTAVAGLVAAAIVLSVLQPSYIYWPDEPLYQHLARALADGQGFTWRGEQEPLRAALYVYLIAPAWMIAGGVDAYTLAKVETAIFCCLVAVPVWLLARRFLPRPLVLLCVVLVLSGSWMASTGSLLTESIGLPLATASLAAMVQALAARAPRWAMASILLALVAAWSRMQLVVLLPILLVAMGAHVLRVRSAWRSETATFRAPLAVLVGLGLVAIGATVVAGPTVTGGYSGVLFYHPSVVGVLRGAGGELLVLAAACALLPLLALVPLVAQRASWRDVWIGSLLCVVVPAVVVLALQNGFYVASTPGLWPVQRYMVYAAPLLLVLFVAAAEARMLSGRAIAAMAMAALVLLATPAPHDIGEQRAVWATTARVRDVLHGAPAGVSLLLVALLLCAVLAVALRRRGEGRPLAVAGSVALAALLLVQTGSAWYGQLHVLAEARRSVPSDRAWLEHHRHGDVAVLEVTANAPEFGIIDFFNRGITRFYAYQNPLPGRRLQGGRCAWYIDKGSGAARFEPGCPPTGDEYFINDPGVRLHFDHEVRSFANPMIGRLVTVRGPLRLWALVEPPCDRFQAYDPESGERLGSDATVPCRPLVQADLWLRRPGTLVVAFRPAPFTDQAVVVAGRRTPIPAGVPTRIRIPVRPGANHITIRLSWAKRSPLDAALQGVELRQGGRTQSLL